MLANHWDAAGIDSPGKVRIGELLPLKSNTLVIPGAQDLA
jgi:hypothetical protein